MPNLLRPASTEYMADVLTRKVKSVHKHARIDEVGVTCTTQGQVNISSTLPALSTREMTRTLPARPALPSRMTGSPDASPVTHLLHRSATPSPANRLPLPPALRHHYSPCRYSHFDAPTPKQRSITPTAHPGRLLDLACLLSSILCVPF
jgi:hypothetical protein